jgi:hypothetical protein
MAKEVSVLLASTNLNEPLTPISVMETATIDVLRPIVALFIDLAYCWGDEQKDEVNIWVDEIVDDLYCNSEYTDFKSTSELRMSLHSVRME